MLIKSIPTSNPELFTFHLKFRCTDVIPGERHYLEHMMLNSNSRYSKDELRSELAKLADDSLFSAATSMEHIYFSGTYLQEDAPKAFELLTSVLEGPLFLEEEVEKERKIILQELAMSLDDPFFQSFVTLSEMIGRDLTVLGSEENIRSITADDLKAAFKRSILTSNAEMFFHGHAPDLLFQDGEKSVSKRILLPAGETMRAENSNMSTSMVYHCFDVEPTFETYFLSSYLNHTSAPLFVRLREELHLCYMVGTMQVMQSKENFHHFALFIVTNEDPESVVEELYNAATVEDEEIFKSVWKSWRMNFVTSKSSLGGRMGMEKFAHKYDMSYEELEKYTLTWDMLKETAAKVLSAPKTTIIIKGTKVPEAADEEE